MTALRVTAMWRPERPVVLPACAELGTKGGFADGISGAASVDVYRSARQHTNPVGVTSS